MPKTISSNVSVIIPTFNYGRFIADAIGSVFRQTYPIFEIIVVDDGSTDDTESIVKKFGSRICYVKQKNAGVCVARNNGVANSSGEFIAFLDADDIWKPEKLAKQIAKFAEDKEIGLVHCGMREFDSETGETIAMHLEGGEGWVSKAIALWEKPVILGPSTIIIRRDVFEDIGGFDSKLKNGEDWEFCFRVSRKYKVGFVAEPLVNYRSHAKNATKNIKEMERSTLIAWAKVFNTDDLEIRALHRRSYGNLHKVLAGSFLKNQEYGGFIRNLIKSLWFRPSYLGYYFSLLLRRE